ncbi:MAG: N-acetyl-alpha-D-glucosaminyl L-malate synthase BshA [Myxococcales bacterium]|nr:N-acetyl-alpha-D-glucosaminyl L-malate synthase BshA [Myxococcales bacterium]
MPSNIGVVCFPTVGGSGILATELGVALAKRGHRVHFVCTGMPTRLEPGLDNIFFHGVEAKDYPVFPSAPYALALASRLVEVVQYEQLDIVHVHYAIPHATSAYLAKAILGNGRPKILLTLHGTDVTLVGSDPSYLAITRFSILQSDFVTVPSESLRDQTYNKLSIPPEFPIEVVPNFVDMDRFRPAAVIDRSHLAALFYRCPKVVTDIYGDATVLIHVSNFRPVKRIADVLDIFRRVASVRNAVLVLVGDGPDRSRAEAFARQHDLWHRVAFLGKQEHVGSWLTLADIFLFPSENESFGLAALEAQSTGLPVVGSDAGGIREVVEDSVTGFLHSVGDTAAMAQSVIDLIDDKNRRHQMGLAARSRVNERFRLDGLVTRYERIIEDLAAGH